MNSNAPAMLRLVLPAATAAALAAIFVLVSMRLTGLLHEIQAGHLAFALIAAPFIGALAAFIRHRWRRTTNTDREL
jgi:hypothetical protein